MDAIERQQLDSHDKGFRITRMQLAAWDCCPGDVVAITRDIELNTSLTHENTGFGTAADLGDINSTDSSIHPR